MRLLLVHSPSFLKVKKFSDFFPSASLLATVRGKWWSARLLGPGERERANTSRGPRAALVRRRSGTKRAARHPPTRLSLLLLQALLGPARKPNYTRFDSGVESDGPGSTAAPPRSGGCGYSAYGPDVIGSGGIHPASRPSDTYKTMPPPRPKRPWCLASLARGRAHWKAAAKERAFVDVVQRVAVNFKSSLKGCLDAEQRKEQRKMLHMHKVAKKNFSSSLRN